MGIERALAFRVGRNREVEALALFEAAHLAESGGLEKVEGEYQGACFRFRSGMNRVRADALSGKNKAENYWGYPGFARGRMYL